MSKQAPKMIVTAALPYANGPIHLGHMVEYIQADIWVRFHRLQKRQCYFVCGEDAHGTAIMISAEKAGMTPEALIAESRASHEADFNAFNISFDSYHTTHSKENRELAYQFFEHLQSNNDIEVRRIEQAYDTKKGLFLPDRFIKGTCPKCHTLDQYGDNCEACGAIYQPTDLIDPRSTLSDTTPETRQSEHYFFRLDKHSNMLKAWVNEQNHLQPEVAHKLAEWFEVGLEQWDISRDAPYFGFEIPGTRDKYFYVWLDAPIGYMASFKHYCNTQDEQFDTFWDKDSTEELYHFIGKDIIYFHALFWPAMLYCAGFRLPTAIFAHGFLTINGKKMSKSRGTFITAKQYLENLDAEYLRYYYAAKLSGGIDDIDLNLSDFTQRVNTDLVNKVINIASRSAGFLHRSFDGLMADKLESEPLYQTLLDKGKDIAQHYQSRDTNKAVREIIALADLVNQYIDQQKPWVLAKADPADPHIQLVCSQGINCFRLLMLYLKPITPSLVSRAEGFLNAGLLQWDNELTPLLNHHLAPFTPLLLRLDPDHVNALSS